MPGTDGAAGQARAAGLRPARLVRAALAALLLVAAPADAETPPALSGAVNDFAGVIDAGP